MNRKQSLVAAKFLQPLFDPASGHKQWEAARRTELVEEVNNEFVKLGMEKAYTVKKLECWLGNTMYRWRCEQKGRRPTSWEARNPLKTAALSAGASRAHASSGTPQKSGGGGGGSSTPAAGRATARPGPGTSQKKTPPAQDATPSHTHDHDHDSDYGSDYSPAAVKAARHLESGDLGHSAGQHSHHNANTKHKAKRPHRRALRQKVQHENTGGGANQHEHTGMRESESWWLPYQPAGSNREPHAVQNVFHDYDCSLHRDSESPPLVTFCASPKRAGGGSGAVLVPGVLKRRRVTMPLPLGLGLGPCTADEEGSAGAGAHAITDPQPGGAV